MDPGAETPTRLLWLKGVRVHLRLSVNGKPTLLHGVTGGSNPSGRTVLVAERLMPRTVIPVNAGSNPVQHPMVVWCKQHVGVPHRKSWARPGATSMRRSHSGYCSGL